MFGNIQNKKLVGEPFQRESTGNPQPWERPGLETVHLGGVSSVGWLG